MEIQDLARWLRCSSSEIGRIDYSSRPAPESNRVCAIPRELIGADGASSRVPTQLPPYVTRAETGIVAVTGKFGLDEEVRARPSRQSHPARPRIPQLADASSPDRKQCALDAAGERTLEMAVRRLKRSARAHDRLLKVARTIADLDTSESIFPSTSPKPYSIAAVQYRSLDRNYWN